jgi:hypothetical protein
VTTPGGTSATSAGVKFTYTTPPPVVTSISPTSGTTAGGTSVTITGSGFTGATKVLFGTVAATSYMVVSDTQITAVSPAQTASIRNIFVTTPGGTSATVAGDKFTYTTPGSGGVVGTSLIPAAQPGGHTLRDHLRRRSVSVRRRRHG